MKIKRRKVNDPVLDNYTLSLIKVSPEDTERLSNKHKINKKPEGKVPKGKLWCVYCNDYKYFKIRDEINKNSNYKRCEGCGMSDNDFHIKNANGLWHK
jgi:Pyruvate/2-oxoacid:ferredoxin oxidoreductase delta subunit